MLSVWNNIRNTVNPSCVRNSCTQLQQVRTRYVDWRMLKDHKKRQTVKQYGPERFRTNLLRKNNVLPPEIRAEADKEIAAFPSNSSISKIVYRCSLTSRPTGNVKEYRMSRICFRHLADYNLLSGVQRAFW